MRLAEYKENKFLPLIIVFIAIALVAFAVLSTRHVSAACINPCIPISVQNELQAYDDNCTAPCGDSNQCYGDPSVGKLPYYGRTTDWVSVAGNSGVNYGGPPDATWNIPYGTAPSINLQLNNLIYICHPAVAFYQQWPQNFIVPNIPVTPSNYTQPLNSPPVFASGIFLPAINGYIFQTPSASGGTISSWNPGNINISYQQNVRFWFPDAGSNDPTFTFTPPSNLPPGLHTFTISVPVISANEFIMNIGGVLHYAAFCVNGAEPTSFPENPANCLSYPAESDPFTLTVNVQPPPDVNPPTINAAASCTNGNVTGNAADADDPGGNLTVNWSSTDGRSGTIVTTGGYTIPMASDDQLHNYTVHVSVGDIDAAGAPGSLATATASASYGPCFAPACGGLPQLLVNGDVIGAQDGPAVGVPFNVQATIDWTATAQNPGGTIPTALGGILTIKFGAVSWNFAVTANGKAFFQGTSPSYSVAATGNYNYSYSFADGGVTLNCPTSGAPPSITVLNHPYFNVEGGDVETGFGGFGSSCTHADTNAGVVAFNNGNSGVAGQANLGSGTNLAAFAPDVINGFDTSNGTTQVAANPYNIDETAGLDFANTGQSAGTYASNFGGGLGDFGAAACATDYYSIGSDIPPLTIPATELGIDNIDNVGDPSAYPTSCVTKGPVGDTTEFCSVTFTNGYEGEGNHIDLCQKTVYNIATHENDCTAGPPLATRLVLFIKGDVEIENNILVNDGTSSPWHGLSSVPELYVITQGDIYLDNDRDEGEGATGLTELDGIYVAQPVAGVGGIIYSCTNGHKITTHTNLNSFCGLGSTTVKGALVAQQIRLDKTYGNIATLNQPAEQVVYGPDDWIMNPFSVTGTPSLNPTYQSIAGLPPVL